MSIDEKSQHAAFYGDIGADCTDLNTIVNWIDNCEGRNAALKKYIYALRDVSRAHSLSLQGEATDGEVDAAEARATVAFNKLITCQHRLDDASGQGYTVGEHFGHHLRGRRQ
jgi:hypothetical protein